MRDGLEGVRLAITTFTVLPMRPARLDRRTAAWAMACAPLVGVALAAIAAGVLFTARLAYPEAKYVDVEPSHVLGGLLASMLAVATLGLLTRGLHLDGLADTVDGLASRAGPEEARAIMRQGQVGALGAVSLIAVLAVQVVALGIAVLDHRGTQAIVLATLTGRVAITWGCARGVPAARPDGMGAVVAGSLPRLVPWCWTVLLVAAATTIGWFDEEPHAFLAALRGAFAVLVGLGVAGALQRLAVRRFGGITGDVLGASCELAAAACLIVVAAGHASH